MCEFRPQNNYRPVRLCPASSVSDNHSAQIGDIEAFMVVWMPEGPPQCLDIFLPPERVMVSLIEHGERGALMCHLGLTLTSGSKSLCILGDN